jgi:Uma2 family endonuclease
MMVAEKINLTESQEEKLEAGGVVVIPAEWDDFEEFLHRAEYRVTYHNGNIIIMGLATLTHELIVITIAALLRNFYVGKPGYYVAGSNVGIRKLSKKGHYNADVVVIKGQPDYYQASKSIITNPFLIAEVLSKSTAAYDTTDKLMAYQKMESVQIVVFVSQSDFDVTVFTRADQPGVWQEIIYTNPTDVVQIAELAVPMSDIFTGLPTA